MNEIKEFKKKLAHLAKDQLAKGSDLAEDQRIAQENLGKVQRNAQENLGKVQREQLHNFWSEVKLALSPIMRKVGTILTSYLSEGRWKENATVGAHAQTQKALKLKERLHQHLLTNSSPLSKQCINSTGYNKERWELLLGEVCLYLKELLYGLRPLIGFMENGENQELILMQVQDACSEIKTALELMSAIGKDCVVQYSLIWQRTNGTHTLAFPSAESVRFSAAKTRNVQSTNANRFKI